MSGAEHLEIVEGRHVGIVAVRLGACQDARRRARVAGMDEVETAQTDAADIPVISPPGRANLVPPFQPGQSGNPLGRPKDEDRLLARMLRQSPDALHRAAKRLAEVLDDPTSRHWLGALKEVTDRHEGPVATQAHHHVSTDRAVVVHPQTAHAPELPHAGSGQAAQALPEQRAAGASAGGQGGGDASVPDPAACIEGAPADQVDADPERLGDPIRDASYDDDASGPAAPESAP